jgi:hypothetical protein
MSNKLSFKDANGRTISGHFVVSKGIIVKPMLDLD